MNVSRHGVNDSIHQSINFAPSVTTERVYQVTAGVFFIVQLYVFVSLVTYELLMPDKPKAGRHLRILCLLATATSFLHECLQQLIVLLSGDSQAACAALMATKSTVFNAVVTWTYGFFWLRQYMFYSSPTLRHLRNRTMRIITWIVLAFLIINPCVMFGFQFKGKLYEVRDGVCLVLRLPIVDQLPFISVAFSYSFIQVALIFLYFYPLHKRNIPKSSPRPMSATATPIMHTPDVNELRRGTHTHTHTHTHTQEGESKLDWSNDNLKRTTLTIENIRKQFTSAVTAKHNHAHKMRSLERRMRRWLILGLICVTSDVISATIIAVFLLAITPATVVTYMFLWHDVSMLISVLCTVGCFNEFRVMLFPYKAVSR